MNKQNKISLILGVLVLTVLIISSSFAFFQITNTGSTETNTTLTGNLEDVESYGTASLSGPNNKLHIKIKASDMAPTKIGTHYYATIDPDLDYELEKQNHLISTASIDNGEGNDDVVYECTSDLLIEASGSLVTDNVINADDGNIYFGGSGSTIDPTEISLKDIIDAQSEGGYKKQVKYKITGNGEATLTTDIDIINRDDDQNDIAGKQIDLTITNKNLVCTVKGLQEKAYMVKVGYEEYWDSDTGYIPMFNSKWFDWNIMGNIISVAFVDYIPSDLEDNEIVEYRDLSDTEMGTSEGSVIAWVEDSGQQNEYEESLYNLYIGSESKIYAKYLDVLFANMSELQNVDFSNLDTSETISMVGMFDIDGYYGEAPIFNLNLSDLDTSHVENMSYMFRSSNANITFPQGFGSAATDMSYMFYDYRGTALDLSNFETSSAIDMSYMFSQYQGTSLDLSGFNTSQVTDMSGMFQHYEGTSLDLSSFDTSSVTDMSEMFQATSIDLPFKDWSNFVTTNVENMSDMFSWYQGTTLDLSNFDTSQVTDMSSMFSYMSINIPFKDWPKFVTTNVKNMSYMFSGYEGTALDLTSFDTSKVSDMSGMFSYTSIDLPFKEWNNFTTTNVKNMSWMFSDYQGNSLDLSSFDTSKVIDMSYMFGSLNGFNTISIDLPFKDWSKFVTTNVEDMSYMFSWYRGTSLDLSTFDTSKVTDMSGMFQVTSIDLPFKNWSNFVTTNVENMSEMFLSYRGTTLDLSNFDTSKVTDMSGMFKGYQGTSLDLNSFDTSQVTDMSGMFDSINYLKYLNLSSFKFDNVNEKYYGTDYTFRDVPSNCDVKIKKSQQKTFEEKFPLNGRNGRTFEPDYVD